IGDVGQDLWEEIDYQKASGGGEDYGWRCYEGSHPYNTVSCGPMSSYVFPIYEYSHYAGNAALIGGYVYRGAEYANMFGKYFLDDQYTAAYGFRTITPDGSGGYIVDTTLGSLGRVSVVSFGEDLWGELYAADYSTGGI